VDGSASSQSAGTRLCKLPEDARNSARLHMIAHARRLDGGSVAPFDADTGCSDPKRHSWRYPATVSLPQQRPAIASRAASLRLGSIA
jgi:hypothetical protein